MTETASADDAALVKLYHPDVAKTLELLDQGGAMPPMRLRPGLQVAEMMYSQQFKGEAINLTLLTDGRSADSPAPVANRKVPTTSR